MVLRRHDSAASTGTYNSHIIFVSHLPSHIYSHQHIIHNSTLIQFIDIFSID